MSIYSDLSQNIDDYKAKMAVKDRQTPEQQVAMALLHNVDVMGGSHLAVCMVIPMPTLRALVGRGLIDDRGRLTKDGNAMLKSWIKEDRKPRFGVACKK